MILGSRSNIRAWFKFNGNANDSSYNGYNLTVAGAVLTADKWSNVNKAYSFNGTNQTLFHSALYVDKSGYELNIMFKSDSANTQMILTNRYDVGTQRYFYLYISNGGTINALCYNASGTLINVSCPYSSNTWYDLTIQYDSVDGMKLYKDGNLVDSDPTNGLLVNYDNAFLFARRLVGGVSSLYYDGIIQECRLNDNKRKPLNILNASRTQNYRKAL